MSCDDPSVKEATKKPPARGSRTFQHAGPSPSLAGVFGRAAALSVAGTLVSACASGARYDHAVRVFSSINLCPAERVAVRQVDPPSPPAEVASDPERLSMWQAKKSGYTFYLLEGCGQSSVWHCYWGGCRFDH